MNHYLPKHFKVEELVPPDIAKSLEAWRIWLLFDARILWTLDAIRDLYGRPITVNNWTTGGNLTLRGWRPADANLVPGVTVDQHKYGRAVDFNIDGVDPKKFCDDVLKITSQYEYNFITGLELGKTWNHIDCRNFDKRNNGGKPQTF